MEKKKRLDQEIESCILDGESDLTNYTSQTEGSFEVKQYESVKGPGFKELQRPLMESYFS